MLVYELLKKNNMPKRKTISDYMAIGTLSAQWMIKNVVFVFFLGFIGVVYIANAHFAERKVREIQSLKKEVKQLRWEYMSLKSDVMYKYKLSELRKEVKGQGLKLSRPKKITVRN